MSSIPFLKIYTSSDDVVGLEHIDINYASAGFSSPPVIVASVDGDVNVFVSNITSTSARLNFSAIFTGRVTYIVRPATT